MKTFIFAYDRYETMTTSLYFKDYKHTVLCHTVEDKSKFINAGTVAGDIISTGNPKGLAYNRNFALDMMDTGEWAVFFVDDLISVTMWEKYFTHKDERLPIKETGQPILRKQLKTICTPADFYEICNESIKKAENMGFALVGFSLTDNPLFREKKWSYWGLADGRCWLVKKTHLRFDEKAQLIDDTCFTALNLKQFGGVVINNWLLPNCQRYTDGAFGSISKRMPQKIKECKYLVETYPEFIQYSPKSGWPENSHVKIRPKSSRTIVNQNTLF